MKIDDYQMETFVRLKEYENRIWNIFIAYLKIVMLGDPEMHWLTWVIMLFADALAPNTCQGISNHYAYYNVVMVWYEKSACWKCTAPYIAWKVIERID